MNLETSGDRVARKAVRLVPLAVEVPEVVADRIGTLAKKVGETPTRYAGTLLMAAYTARTKETGDCDLDDAVGRVVVLDALVGLSAEDIAAHVSLSPDTVRQIVSVWREQVRGTRAPRPPAPPA